MDPAYTRQCRVQGSAEEIVGDTGGDSVLALCNAFHLVEELNDSTGVPAVPSVFITLESDPCPTTTGGYTSSSDVAGWYRAFPLDHVGAF